MKPIQTTQNWQPHQVETSAGSAWSVGDESVLQSQKLALICSQNCPGDVILKTYDFARLVRTSSHVIVSGFHSPIEKDCLPSLLRGSNPVIVVQAHRLSTSRLLRDWQKAIEAGRLLLLSPFAEKNKRVTSELATERNRFVAAISDEILIPYATPRGKTENLFRDLIGSGKRVYVFNIPANSALISAGAIPIEPDHWSCPDRMDISSASKLY